MAMAAGGAAPRPPLSRRLSQPSYFLLLLLSNIWTDERLFRGLGDVCSDVSADVESLSSAVSTEARCLFVVTGLRHSVVHVALTDFHTAALGSACHSCTENSLYLFILHQPVKRSSLVSLQSKGRQPESG